MKKVYYTINIIVALGLISCYILPYLNPSEFPVLSLMTLTTPIWIILNLFFLIFWLLKSPKKITLSILIALLSIPLILRQFQPNNKEIQTGALGIELMTYNVRLFNLYSWESDGNTDDNMYQFIQDKNPDLLVLQEFYDDPKVIINYPNHYKKITQGKHGIGQIIYSKYPIIHSGSLNFTNSSNNAIFIDVLIQKDTLRVYNLHLESFRLNPKSLNFDEESSKSLLKRFNKGFQMQAQQTEKILKHSKDLNYPYIIAGDFNNTPYSFIYREFSKTTSDAFLEVGSGFGKTYDFLFPMRIDYVLGHPSVKFTSYKEFKEEYSDHYPVLTEFQLP